MATPLSVTPLSEAEFDFVDQYMTLRFLKQFGTQYGYTNFCRRAAAGGNWTCPGGKASKISYATYLRNAEVANGVVLLKKATEAYMNTLDKFSQDALKTRISRGKRLAKAPTKVTVNKSCALNLTAPQIQRIASIAGISIAGLTPLQACAKLSADPATAELFPTAEEMSVDRPRSKLKYRKYMTGGLSHRTGKDKLEEIEAPTKLGTPDVDKYLPESKGKTDWSKF